MQKQQVIVSLTSFPEAIRFVVPAVQSILAGSVLPDKIVLYLAASQFPDRKIPPELAPLEGEPLFEVRFCDRDIRSYKKLIPALHDFPDAIIITVDDDIRYGKHLLKQLLRLHKKYPDAIIGHRVRRIEMERPYQKWKRYKNERYLTRSLKPAFRNLMTGGAGGLYPPGALDPEMLDPDIFMKMAPTTDDIWFWAAAVANGTKTAPVPFGYWDIEDLDKPMEISLKGVNVHAGVDVNRAVFDNILEKYPVIRRNLEK